MDDKIQDITDKLAASNRKTLRAYLGGTSAIMIFCLGFMLTNMMTLNRNVALLMETKADKAEVLKVKDYKKCEMAQMKFFYTVKIEAIKPEDSTTLEEILELNL